MLIIKSRFDQKSSSRGINKLENIETQITHI